MLERSVLKDIYNNAQRIIAENNLESAIFVIDNSGALVFKRDEFHHVKRVLKRIMELRGKIYDPEGLDRNFNMLFSPFVVIIHTKDNILMCNLSLLEETYG